MVQAFIINAICNIVPQPKCTTKKNKVRRDLIGAWIQRGPEAFADLLYSALQLLTYIDQYSKTIYKAQTQT